MRKIKKKIDLDEIFDEALENARKDREKTEKALDDLQGVFDVDFKNNQGLEGAMLVGGNYIKLLEQLTRSNEQIVKLAQLKEKENSHGEKTHGPINVQDIIKHAEQLEENGVKIRIDDEVNEEPRKKTTKSNN